MILDHDKANGRVALSTKTLEPSPGYYPSFRYPSVTISLLSVLLDLFKFMLTRFLLLLHSPLLLCQTSILETLH